jgi:hypothetical protein
MDKERNKSIVESGEDEKRPMKDKDKKEKKEKKGGGEAWRLPISPFVEDFVK